MNSWNYYNLKLPDETTWLASVPAAWLDEDGKPAGAHGRALDVLGEIYIPAGGTDANGLPLWQQGSGWCVNIGLLGDAALPASLQPYVIAPPTLPKHVWA